MAQLCGGCEVAMGWSRDISWLVQRWQSSFTASSSSSSFSSLLLLLLLFPFSRRVVHCFASRKLQTRVTMMPERSMDENARKEGRKRKAQEGGKARDKRKEERVGGQTRKAKVRGPEGTRRKDGGKGQGNDRAEPPSYTN